MTEYVLRLRLVTDAQPRDTINWDAIALVAGGLFKARPVLPIALVSAVVEQIEPATVRGPAPDGTPPLSSTTAESPPATPEAPAQTPTPE